jgi:Uma2 family endonuclease
VLPIDITSFSLPRLPIYASLGIPEVWRFDGEKILLLALVNGNYQEVAVSIALPIVTVEILQDWLSQAKTMGESSWAMAIQRWVQEAMIGRE